MIFTTDYNYIDGDDCFYTAQAQQQDERDLPPWYDQEHYGHFMAESDVAAVV